MFQKSCKKIKKSLVFTLAFTLCASFAYAEEQLTGPLELKDTVRKALDFNPSLKSIQEQRESLLHDLDKEKAQWKPRIDAVAQTKYAKGGSPTTRAARANSLDWNHGGQAELTVTQTLWDGLTTYNRVAAANLRNSAIDGRLADTATLLAMEAVQAHIDLLRHSETYALAKEYVTTHQDILAQVTELSYSGTGTSSDSDQAKGRLQRAIATLTTAKTNLDIGKSNYELVTGIKAPQLVSVSAIALPSQAIDEVVEESFRTNPRIFAYEEETKALSKDRDSIKGRFSPIVELQVGPSYLDPNYQRRSNKTWDFGVRATLTWNLYNGGADRANMQSIAAQSRQLKQEMFAYGDALKNDIYNAYANYQSALELITIYSDAIEYNKLTRDSYIQQFSMGMRTLLDVLDAEGELFNSQSSLILARYNLIAQAYKISALQGLILSQFNIDPSEFYAAPKNARQ